MPNGRPGDHPLTDMLHYGMSSQYPEDVLELVREMGEHPHFAAVRERVESLLWENWPHWQNVEPDMTLVRKSLQRLRDELG